jgi:diacylglycerol kinase family enzyme
MLHSAAAVSPLRQWGERGRHLLLIANASASGIGGRRARLDRALELLRSRGARVEAHLTESLAELEFAAAAADGRRLVLLGGDGTLHAAANLPFRVPELALIPAGRANNVARSVGVPLDPAAAAALAVDGIARPLDAIAATSNERRYRVVEGLSVGLHALARARYHAPNSADLYAGMRAALSAARGFRGVTVVLDSDGTAEVLTLGQLFVSNLPLYAFGLRVAPQADPADGLADLVAIEETRPAALLPIFARLRRGSHVGRPRIRTWTARRVCIATGGHSPVIADSTDLGPGPVRLAVEPAALDLVAPAS